MRWKARGRELWRGAQGPVPWREKGGVLGWTIACPRGSFSRASLTVHEKQLLVHEGPDGKREALGEGQCEECL